MNRESLSNFIKYETNSGNRMSIGTYNQLVAQPNKTPSQHSSRGSNEFNPRIILSNSLKNSMEPVSR